MSRDKTVAGTFEIIQEGEVVFLFRLTAGDGTVVAISPRFTTIQGVVDGIEAVRENAAAGFVVDRSSGTTDPGQACSSRVGGQLMDESSLSRQQPVSIARSVKKGVEGHECSVGLHGGEVAEAVLL